MGGRPFPATQRARPNLHDAPSAAKCKRLTRLLRFHPALEPETNGTANERPEAKEDWIGIRKQRGGGRERESARSRVCVGVCVNNFSPLKQNKC